MILIIYLFILLFTYLFTQSFISYLCIELFSAMLLIY